MLDSNGHVYHDCKNSLGMIEYALQLEIEFKTYKTFVWYKMTYVCMCSDHTPSSRY